MAIDVTQKDGVIVLKPSGKLIGSAVSDLRKTIDSELPDSGENPRLLVDFADVTMMDSSGLGTLMGTHVSIAKKGGRIGIINVGTNIKNLIIRSRLISTFEHFDSENEAVTALAS
ncbi:MAG: STAS domain-containing protein [Candidatus Poribacteria bacterium]|nr:STAS domain-containing protein [Candidatus Poribacteria bacterium]